MLNDTVIGCGYAMVRMESKNLVDAKTECSANATCSTFYRSGGYTDEFYRCEESSNDWPLHKHQTYYSNYGSIVYTRKEGKIQTCVIT